MKKIFMLTIAMFMLFACSQKKEVSGDSKTANEDTKKASAEKVTINVFQFKVEFLDQFKELADVYMKANPNVKLNIETVGGGSDYGQALKAKFTSGDEPTIFNIGGPQDVYDWLDTLDDLANEPWVSKAYQGVLEPVTLDGKIYGMPFSQEGYGLIYNKKIFEKAGIDPNSIDSFAKLEDAVNKLEEQKDALGIEAVFTYPGKETWVLGLHTANASLGQEFNMMEAYKSKTVNFKYGKGFKMLVDLMKDHAYDKESINRVDYLTQVEKTFSLEKVAIIQQGNWVFNQIKDINPELAENIGFLPIPTVGAKEDSIAVGIPMYWAINKNKSDAEKKAAKEFLNWMYTSPQGQEFVINKFKFIPALSGYDKSPDDPLSKDILKYSKAGKTTPWVFMGFPSSWGMDVLGANIQKYMAGEITWEEVESNSKKAWEDARK